MPTADADTQADGGSVARSIAAARVDVVSVRLRRINRRYRRVHGIRARLAPDRLITASAHSIASCGMTPLTGSQRYSSAAASRRTRRRSSCDSAWCVTAVPIMPDAPANRILMVRPFRSVHVDTQRYRADTG